MDSFDKTITITVLAISLSVVAIICLDRYAELSMASKGYVWIPEKKIPGHYELAKYIQLEGEDKK